MTKLLTICIPTHQGRAGFLIEAVGSILGQLTPDLWDAVEISISDNASSDGTEDLVRSWQALYGEMFVYTRFERNQGGFPNFDQSINQATGEFCWLLGSDDALLDGAIARVAAFCREHPETAGFSVNKGNYSLNLRREINRDHPHVLPDEPDQHHDYDDPNQILVNCAFVFGYMSAHVFRRAYWQAVVREHGADYIHSLRHFPHAFVFGSIVCDHPQWAWLPECMVKQRTDNSCLMEERGNRYDIYLREVLEDMDKVWSALIPDEQVRRGLRQRFYTLYLDFAALRRIKRSPKFGRRDDVGLWWFCWRYFRSVPQFRSRGVFLVLLPHWVYKMEHAFNRLRAKLQLRSRFRAALGTVAVIPAIRDADEPDPRITSRVGRLPRG